MLKKLQKLFSARDPSRYYPERPGPCWCNGPYELEEHHHAFCRAYRAYHAETGEFPKTDDLKRIKASWLERICNLAGVTLR